jgi:TolB protein
MHLNYRNFLIVFFCSLLFANDSLAEVIILPPIGSASSRKVPLAVPDFFDKRNPGRVQPSAKEMAKLLSRALDFHGFFRLIPKKSYGGSHDQDWRQLGAEFVVIGQYDMDSVGIKLELRLLNVHENRMILGRRYRGKWIKNKQVVLKFCDDVISKLTGERGISSSKISYISDETGYKEVFVADVMGENIRQITHHRGIVASPRFSPDVKKLTYTSYHHNNPDLYLTELSENNKFTRAISRRKGLNFAPSWMPDGRKMIICLKSESGTDLFMMTTKGKKLAKMTNDSGSNVSPSISPNGKQVAFVSDRSGRPQIYVMDIRTKAVKRITYKGTYNSEPNWSPKGDWIVYTGRYRGNNHLFLIKPKGGSPRRLTNSGGDHETPCWSPDGRQIVFSFSRKNEKRLCRIFKNGTGKKTLFNLSGKQKSPQWSARVKIN